MPPLQAIPRGIKGRSFTQKFSCRSNSRDRVLCYIGNAYSRDDNGGNHSDYGNDGNDANRDIDNDGNHGNDGTLRVSCSLYIDGHMRDPFKRIQNIDLEFEEMIK